MTAKLLVALVVCLFVAGGVVAVLQPWNAGLGSAETAKQLARRLKTPDEFNCEDSSGRLLPGEPDWDYDCTDITHPERQGYFVKVSSKRITAIQPSG